MYFTALELSRRTQGEVMYLRYIGTRVDMVPFHPDQDSYMFC